LKKREGLSLVLFLFARFSYFVPVSTVSFPNGDGIGFGGNKYDFLVLSLSRGHTVNQMTGQKDDLVLPVHEKGYSLGNELKEKILTCEVFPNNRVTL
jgi:hypothetical protein